MKLIKGLVVIAALITVLALIGRARQDVRPFDPAEYAPDEVAVLDAVGTSADRVKDVRRAGRTPVCYVQGPDVDRALAACRAKGFDLYVIASG